MHASERLIHIALLIDCENAKSDSIDGILSELAERGTISIRRAYGDWKRQGGWEEKLHPFAIQPIQQFAYTKGKNAVDMYMAIDAMDLLYTEKVDCFALVTSDCRLHAASAEAAFERQVGDRLRREQDARTIQEGVLGVHSHRQLRETV